VVAGFKTRPRWLPADVKFMNRSRQTSYFHLRANGMPLLAVAAASLLCTSAREAHAVNAAALFQQGKPSIANEVEKTDKKPGADNENGAKAGETAKPGSRHRVGSRPVTPQPVPLDVTFKTDVPEAEIFVNLPAMKMQKLGKTDADGKLTVKLARGAYNITASRVGQRSQRQQIEVRQGNTEFNFTLKLPTAQAPTETAKKDETPLPVTPAEETAKDDASAVEAVLKRFLDPKETESVVAKDWEVVQTQSNAALEKEPDNPRLKAQVLLAQGQLAFSNKDYASALVTLNKAVLTDPDMTAAQYSLGNAYLATNQPDQAFKAYQRASQLDQELALAYKGIGDVFTRQGKSKEALAYYERAKTLGHVSAETNYSSAQNLMKRKRWSEALKELQEISKKEPTADVFIYIGNCYVEMKQPLSASQAYHKATELDPKSALAAYRYGALMYEIHEYATASEALERALALDLTGASINRQRAREMANKAAEKIRKMK
jgi:tetratricopeptide (TPR) repeat protein